MNNFWRVPSGRAIRCIFCARNFSFNCFQFAQKDAASIPHAAYSKIKF
jgi:hypothetical protein